MIDEAAAFVGGGALLAQRRRGAARRCSVLRRGNVEVKRGSVVVATAVSPAVQAQTSRRDGEGTNFEHFKRLAESAEGVNLVPVWRRAFSDQLTPVTLYRCLVAEDDLEKSSYLLESVLSDGSVGRYSFVGSDPAFEVIAKEKNVTFVDRRKGEPKTTVENDVQDPWNYIRQTSDSFKPAEVPGLPQAFTGGWVGYGGYDTARYMESDKLPFSSAPRDDQKLPDLHMSIYLKCVTFDIFSKICYLTSWVDLREHSSLESAYTSAMDGLNELVNVVKRGQTLSKLDVGMVDIDESGAATTTHAPVSTMTKEEYMEGVEKCKYYIREGDAFQIVFSQRFQRESTSDPFSVYRALRIVNPSPYMIYMQCKNTILVASSPEILCRVQDGAVTNRPLAGTRRRGKTPEEDKALEEELLADEKELAEHRMLVDLGRNDVGRVAEFGSVKPTKLMNIERYSHVMHVSSTVVGKLREELSCFDALEAALPAGTISGAPKIRAMQIIDELELTKRGPYGGGIGVVSFYQQLNMALALRTMVVPTSYFKENDKWLYLIQAGAGIVADSNPEAEYDETVNKAMAMNRSIDLAEEAFN